MRRFLAETGAIAFGLFATILSVGLFFAAANNLFWPAFLISGFIFYWFGRAWMFQVLEVKRN